MRRVTIAPWTVNRRASREDSGASEDSDSDSADAQRKTLSVAIPVNDEEAVLPELLRRLRAVLDPLPLDYELVFVDDGAAIGA